MSKYKLSNYNHFLYLEEEEQYLVFDSLSNGLAKLEKDLFDSLKSGGNGIANLEKDQSKNEKLDFPQRCGTNKSIFLSKILDNLSKFFYNSKLLIFTREQIMKRHYVFFEEWLAGVIKFDIFFKSLSPVPELISSCLRMKKVTR